MLNFGAGSVRISEYDDLADISCRALFDQYNKNLTFNKMIEFLGGQIVENKEEADFDFSLDNLEKDSFLLNYK